MSTDKMALVETLEARARQGCTTRLFVSAPNCAAKGVSVENWCPNCVTLAAATALREEGEAVWIAADDLEAARVHPMNAHLCFVRAKKTHEKHVPLFRRADTEGPCRGHHFFVNGKCYHCDTEVGARHPHTEDESDGS